MKYLALERKEFADTCYNMENITLNETSHKVPHRLYDFAYVKCLEQIEIRLVNCLGGGTGGGWLGGNSYYC